MKKFIIACALLVLVFVWLPAQSITITSPPAGAAWSLGSSHVITWTYKGLPDSTQVKVLLLLPNEKKVFLVESTGIGKNGSGSWTWSHAGNYIGGKAAAASGYKIRVRDLANICPIVDSGAFALTDTTNSQFIISASLIQPKLQALNTINVIMPAKGLQVKYGAMLEIKWDRTPIATYPQVKFGVYLPDRKTYVGLVHLSDAGLKPNTGDYQDAYVLAYRYEVNKEYVIRVATPDEKFIGFSGVFRVIPQEAVQETETFTGSSSVSFLTTEQSKWPGCFYSMGEGPSWPAYGYAVGWENSMDDPFGPCWKYIGRIYRTVVNPSGIYKGFEVTKAVLRFSVASGNKKQTLYILRRDAAGDGRDVPATAIATVGNWGFGTPIEVDVTAVVQAWCTGQAPNHGLIIRGGDEGFAHNDVKAQCAISAPQLVITRTVYK